MSLAFGRATALSVVLVSGTVACFALRMVVFVDKISFAPGEVFRVRISAAYLPCSHPRVHHLAEYNWLANK